MLAKQAKDMTKLYNLKSINPKVFEQIREFASQGYSQTHIKFETFRGWANGLPKQLELQLARFGYDVTYLGEYLNGDEVVVVISWNEA